MKQAITRGIVFLINVIECQTCCCGVMLRGISLQCGYRLLLKGYTVMTDIIRQLGVVKWFDNAKGYGFIKRSDGDDVFVHFRSIRGDGYRSLLEGQQVEFNLVQSPKGLQAEDVSVVAAAVEA